MARPLMIRRAVQRYRSSGGGQTLWTPLNILGLVLYLDDTDTNFMTLGGPNGSTVTKQIAKNNAALSAAADSTTKSPVLVSNVFGGRPGIQLNTLDTAPERLPAVTVDLTASSIFVAIKTRSATPSGFVLSNDGGGSRIDLYLIGTTLGIDMGGSDHNVGTAPADGVVQWGYVSSGGVATPYVNGTAGSTFSSTTGTNAKLCSGTYAGGGGSAYRGYRGAIIEVAKTMSASDVAKLAGYWFWYLGTPLPSGSPYASRPPYVSDP